MINFHVSHRPNLNTYKNPEIQANLPKSQEAKERYSNLTRLFPGMAASYFPKSSVANVPAPHYAALKGSLKELEALGDFVKLKTVKGLTPLHYALAFGQKEAIRYLLEKCDLSYVTPDGNSYLHYAALTGDPEIIELFLERGIDPALRNKDQLSAAHLWTFKSNDLTCLQKILPPEGSLETSDFTPLQLMALHALHADNNILSDSEWQLFASNAIDLGIVTLSLLCQSFKVENLGSRFLELAHGGVQIAKVDAIHNLAPSSLKGVTNPAMMHSLHTRQLLPIPSKINYFHIPSPAMAFQSAISGTGVAWHSFKECLNLSQVSWKNSLAALGVRLFNTAWSGFADPYLAMYYPHYEGGSCYADAMRSVQKMSVEELKNLPDLSAECQAQFPKLKDPRFPVEGKTNEINHFFRKTSTWIHPDKCPTCSPNAYIHLNKLYKILPKS